MDESADARIILTISFSGRMEKASRRSSHLLAVYSTMKNDLNNLSSQSLSVEDAIKLALERPFWGLLAASGATHWNGASQTMTMTISVKICNKQLVHLSRPEPTSGEVVTCFLASSNRSRTQPFLFGYSTSSFCSTINTSEIRCDIVFEHYLHIMLLLANKWPNSNAQNAYCAWASNSTFHEICVRLSAHGTSVKKEQHLFNLEWLSREATLPPERRRTIQGFTTYDNATHTFAQV